MRSAAAGTWPFRPNPYEDELLSSWMTRIALGHGLKLSAFLSIVGIETNPLTLDLDAAEDVLTFLAEKTGRDRSELLKLKLPFANGPKDLVYRNASGPAVQYCPACLAETAYFRRIWRVSFIRVCERHSTALVDCCGGCGAAVRFEELDPAFGKISVCRNCLRDLAFERAMVIDQKLANRLAGLQERLFSFSLGSLRIWDD
jgi:hypothetical protein